MIRRLILLAALALPGAGCAAGIHTEFRELHPALSPVRAERIAVLPVTGEEGSETYRGVIGDSLLHAVERAHPGVDFIPAEVALEQLHQAGLADRLSDMLVAHYETRQYDRDLLREVGQALQVDHVLQLHVGYDRVSEVSTRLFEPSGEYEADRQNLNVDVVLWDVREGGLAWEAAGTSTTRDAEYELPRSFHDVLAAAAAQLAQRLPLAPLWAAEDSTAGGG